MTFLSRTAAAMLATLAAGPVLAQTGFQDLPNLGDSSGQVYTPQRDRALGIEFMRELHQQNLVMNDPESTRYLASLGRKLTVHSENPGFGFTFFLVDDNSINAFAGPSGYIGTNSGLILAAESESELAGVLAHEIAHVTQRHLARAFESSDKLSLPTMAAIIAGILIGTQNGQAGAAAITAASAANLQSQINFTRANEQEADRVGIQTLADAGFDPNGMANFFERLQKNSRLYGTRPPEFLSTHPVTTNRIAEAESRAGAYQKVTTPDDLEFRLVRARLRVKSYENPAQVLADYQRYHGRNGGDRPDERYEYALLLAATGQYQQAGKVLDDLLHDDQDRLSYRLARADVYQQGHQTDKALALYKAINSLYPGELSVVMPYAGALLANSQAADAYALLRDTSNNTTDNPELYKLLAEAAGISGNGVQAHMAMSQYYYLNGYTDKAIEQLLIAAKTTGLSDYQATAIQARLAQLQTLRKQEELE